MPLDLSRRNFIRGVTALIAAPAIVRVQNIMPVRRPPVYLTLSEITREAVQLFRNTNLFLQNLDAQWQGEFAMGSELRIRLPAEYAATAAPALRAA